MTFKNYWLRECCQSKMLKDEQRVEYFTSGDVNRFNKILELIIGYFEILSTDAMMGTNIVSFQNLI